MSEQSQKTLRKYLIASGAAVLAGLLIMWLQGFFSGLDVINQMRVLADAFSVPGVLLIMIGVLVWVGSEGLFDAFGYAFHHARAMFIPSFRAYRHVTFYDYKMEKAGKRPHGYSFLFFTGLGFLAIGIVFTVIHGIIYVPPV